MYHKKRKEYIKNNKIDPINLFENKKTHVGQKIVSKYLIKRKSNINSKYI